MIKSVIKNFFYNNSSKIHPNLKLSLKSNENRDLNYNIKSFGEFNKDKIFYIIQRFIGGGMFSNINYILHHLYICENLGCIPIIDFKNYPTKYNEPNTINESYNMWDYYFEPINNYKLDDVYKSKFVIISSNKTNKIKEFDSFQNLTQKHHDLFLKYFKIKKDISNEIEIFKNKNFVNKKVLGVHFRGTDMKTQERHPFPPTVQQIISLINSKIKDDNYDLIYLVTEDYKYYRILSEKYKEKLCSYASYRTNQTNIFNNPKRQNHRFNIGKENLIDMYLLSKTDGVVCSESHIPDAAKFVNFYNKNFQLFKIDNGFNSSNILLARFLWSFKKTLPEILGGFKKIF
ncbi:hypothetical protein N9S67_02670 [Candidatus Pelagibacter sp.]|nr:hypothetical protein [Candidatus Pelagibacter sp.]